MPKTSTKYICQQCGYESMGYMGKCPNCGTWNSLVETLVAGTSSKLASNSPKQELISLKDIKIIQTNRTSTKISELDRVLGGGLVPGSVTLIAGEPGIGKSTLLLQTAANLSEVKVEGGKKKVDIEDGKSKMETGVVYISGEESPQQIKLRAERLGVKEKNILFLPETCTENIIQTLSELAEKPKLVIVDSIQTLYSDELQGTAGSIGQVRECTQKLINYAKSNNIAFFIIGHVNKEGNIAGPMVLSHLVDAVLLFEGERTQNLRILRSFKNRFGPTDEVGVFQMVESGLSEIANPSQLFLEERVKSTPGSVVTCIMEGTRPILVEIQALALSSQLPMPRRVASGIDFNRLQLLVAVLSRRAGLALGSYDIFVNVAGGIKITEPGADLAICLAIASAFSDIPLSQKLCAMGEVGLLGEIRNISNQEKRIKEAKKLGYTQIVSPIEAKTVREALRILLPNK